MIDGYFDNTAFKFKNNIPDVLSDLVEDGELYNQGNLLFLEERYIEEASRFSRIVDKFKIKKFDENLKIYQNNNIEKLENFSLEVQLFDDVVAENNVDGLIKKEISISIDHFKKYEQIKKVNFVKSIYILLFLSNYSSYKDNQFAFFVKFEEEQVKKEIKFTNIEEMDFQIFYDWIISSKENLRTRLKIIREIIVRKKSFELDDLDLESAKSAFNRIIKEETDKYFVQVNTLKDDFLKLSERKNKSYKALHIQFLSWLSAIALFVYGELKNETSSELLRKIFLVQNEKVQLFLIIFILAIIIIWIIFAVEMQSNRSEYLKIKALYLKQLFFEEKDFKSYLEEPKISKTYIVLFIVILLLLIVRFFI